MSVHTARTNQPVKALRHFKAITPSNSTIYDPPIVVIRVGGDGNVVATNLTGTDVTFASAVVGELIWGPFSKIKATSTTATNIVGWTNEEAVW